MGRLTRWVWSLSLIHDVTNVLLQEILGLKGKVSELSRRLEDATRAYQQERRVCPYSL